MGEPRDAELSRSSVPAQRPCDVVLAACIYQRLSDHSLELPQLVAGEARVQTQMSGLQTRAVGCFLFSVLL